MKSSCSLMFGAALLAGGWASMPEVAFGDVARASAELPQLQLIGASGDVTSTCHADAEAHASGCTCARCAPANAE